LVSCAIWPCVLEIGKRMANTAADRSTVPPRARIICPPLIVQLRREHPSWGEPKIRKKLGRLHSQISLPTNSTVHAVLDRHGLVSRGRHRTRYKAQGTSLEQAQAPNDLWCADYEGEFMLADWRYHHRCRQPVSAVLRCHVRHQGNLCVCRVWARL
jgi:hypothetical protein